MSKNYATEVEELQNHDPKILCNANPNDPMKINSKGFNIEIKISLFYITMQYSSNVWLKYSYQSFF